MYLIDQVKILSFIKNEEIVDSLKILDLIMSESHILNLINSYLFI